METKMRVKNNNPISLVGNEVSHITRMYFVLNHLKQLFRQGWLRDLPEDKCESVADHCFGVATLLILVKFEFGHDVDIEKALVMALFHELGEIYAGDITPFAGISKEEKHQKEKDAIEKLAKDFPELKFFFSVWKEYEEGKTKEAKLVRQLDKLEMFFQSRIYSKQHGKNLNLFAEDVKGCLDDKHLRGLFDELYVAEETCLDTAKKLDGMWRKDEKE